MTHAKPFRCSNTGCSRNTDGFATSNDLARHERSVHIRSIEGGGIGAFKCFAPGCAKAEKIWPRKDNFRQHLQRMHSDTDIKKLLAIADSWNPDKTDKACEQKDSVQENDLFPYRQANEGVRSLTFVADLNVQDLKALTTTTDGRNHVNHLPIQRKRSPDDDDHDGQYGFRFQEDESKYSSTKLLPQVGPPLAQQFRRKGARQSSTSDEDSFTHIQCWIPAAHIDLVVLATYLKEFIDDTATIKPSPNPAVR